MGQLTVLRTVPALSSYPTTAAVVKRTFGEKPLLKCATEKLKMTAISIWRWSRVTVGYDELVQKEQCLMLVPAAVLHPKMVQVTAAVKMMILHLKNGTDIVY